MKFKYLFGLLFCSALLFFAYNLYVFSILSKLDAAFEINTQFKNTDLHEWLAPQRERLPVTRWHENRTTGVAQKKLRPGVLNECILADVPCVGMLEEIAPARVFWKTGSDLLTERRQVQEELSEALSSKKLKNGSGKSIKTKEELLAELQQEEVLITNGLQEIPWYYRICCGFYNFWNYTPMVFFTFLHHSHTIAALPEWIKNKLNQLASWYMESQYEQIKEDTKKLVKKKTFRLFHWLVESRVEKAFNKLQSKAEKYSYIHDYSPYYRKLRYDFDLEVKNIYTELQRLRERNLALQEIVRSL